MKRILTTSWLLLLIFISSPVFALEGKVVGISDGDTVTVLTPEKQQIKVRLYGVDCPESHQDYGQKAKQFTSDLVFSKTVDLEKIDTDRYGRTVGVIKVGNTVLNEELLKNGFAWYYGQYCKKPFCSQWQQLESQAKSKKAGLWAGNSPVAPWDFRKNKRAGDESSDKAQSNQQIAAGFNGNTKSMVFHQASCKNYDCKNCSEHFASRDEAIKAGYKPCGVCKP
ncbi:thermonuclease family protein [Desulforegula conservatrix]|uniref:thermonuclease family protein n=1 Tax=Desulforegula conservatrix TaxID=153026 RepID=UPI0004070080|nr:thermonuclease family protein [Desulforegula conservatrix]